MTLHKNMSDSKLQFRIAKPADGPRIQQLVEAAFRAEDSRAGWTDGLGLGAYFRLPLEVVTSQIDNPDGEVLVATDEDGEIVGSIQVSRLGDGAPAAAPMGRIALLAVDRSRQQAGLGRRMLAHAEEYCRREWGVRRTGLNALSARELLIRWYARQGYERTGETSPLPRDKLGALSVPDDLCFVEMEKDLGGAGDAA